jgi:hypothetical protein
MEKLLEKAVGKLVKRSLEREKESHFTLQEEIVRLQTKLEVARLQNLELKNESLNKQSVIIALQRKVEGL